MKSIAVATLALLAASPALAQQGVSATEIVIGTAQDLSGPIANFSKAAVNGMRFRVDEVDEAGALDHAPSGDVEARDHTATEHQAIAGAAVGLPAASRTRATTFASSRKPSSPLRSGWNWTPRRAPRATADTNGEPCVVVASATSAPGPSVGRPTYEWTK